MNIPVRRVVPQLLPMHSVGVMRIPRETVSKEALQVFRDISISPLFRDFQKKIEENGYSFFFQRTKDPVGLTLALRYFNNNGDVTPPPVDRTPPSHLTVRGPHDEYDIDLTRLTHVFSKAGNVADVIEHLGDPNVESFFALYMGKEGSLRTQRKDLESH